MSNKSISTGNPVADNFLRRQITNDLGLWALVSYFETKGPLNRDEFFDILNAEAKLLVESIIITETAEQE